MNKSDPSIAAADRSDHCYSYHRLQPSSRAFYASEMEEGIKVVEMLMVVEWQVVTAGVSGGGRWW
ncbi:hypothetical protein Hanom_Chr07g00634581 [Helianthus anomalus]